MTGYEITYDRGYDGYGGGWIDGTVVLDDGRTFPTGGGWVTAGGNVDPYGYSDAGDVGELAEALGVSLDEVMDILAADCPARVCTVPDCPEHPDGEHDWRAPLALGGGTWGHGGGLKSRQYCARCGGRLDTDSWAQSPHSGEVYRHPEEIYTPYAELDTDESADVGEWLRAGHGSPSR